MRKLKFLIWILVPLITACSPRAAGTKSRTATHTEDLSTYRPDILHEDTVENPIPNGIIEPKPTNVTPVHDITYQLDNILDSLEVKAAERTVQGYTVQVYSGNSREAANDAKSLVYRLFPESRPETTYIQPNYKVKVGRYASRMEAQKLFAKLKNDFPGAMVIPEKFALTR